MKTPAYVMGLALLFALLVPPPSHAQNYPTRPVRILVPLAAGGGMDTVTRGLAQKLGDTLGQTVVVDNRPGAGSQIALEILAAAAPDGHTLMMLSSTTVIHPILYKSRFDIVRDFAPVSQITAQGYVLTVHPTIPAKSVAEFVQYLRANPGKLSYASSGIGSPIHMSGELFQVATGTRMTHIPFKGMGAAYTDLIAGRVEVAFPTIISSIPHINAGRLRALAVTTAEARRGAARYPHFRRGGRERRRRRQLVWPHRAGGRRRPSIERISEETAKAMQSPEMTKRLVAEGSEAVGGSPQEFAAHIRAEHELWSRVIKQAGIRGE